MTKKEVLIMFSVAGVVVWLVCASEQNYYLSPLYYLLTHNK